MHATAKVTSKGQITLPKPVRDRLKLQTGDTVEFTVEKTGSARIRPLGPDRASQGVLRHLASARPVSVEEMDEAIRDRARRRDR